MIDQNALFGWIFIAGAVWCVLCGLFVVLRGIKMRGWPRVQGEVLTSKAWREKGDCPDCSFGSKHQVEIEYTYVIDGVHYTRDVVRFSKRGLSHAGMLVFFDRYSEGSKVEVIYNAKNQREAYLDISPTVGWGVFGVFGLIGIGAGIWMLNG